jgi:hypothetical protein
MPLQATSGAASYDAFGGGVAVIPNYIEEVFSTFLYTGNGSTQTITNGIDLAGEGGLVWIKSRNVSESNALYDTARGVNQQLQSNNTDASSNSSNTLTAFNSTGFTLGTNRTDPSVNYVSWTFREQSKFFDVVTYTGDGIQGKTIAHNLGSVPGCIIVKRTDSTGGWPTYHTSLGAGGCLFLNTTEAAYSGLTNRFPTTPTSTIFYVGNAGDVNASGGTYVAYLFAHNAGGFGLTGTDNVISCGSYTGNGSTGQLVNLGYEPQWVLIKQTDAADQWALIDNMRGWAQVDSATLCANTANAENADFGASGATSLDPQGFRLWNANGALNQSGGTYIYIAIRRGPMAVPTTGTRVFSPNTATGSAAITTNFPVDTSISSETGASTGAIWGSRLQGTKQYLSSYNTNAEGSFGGSGWGFSNNTGLNQALYGGSTPSVFWNLVRAPGFHDEVCYTGSGADPQTVSHNLGVAPELMIFKARDVAAGWRVWGGNMAITSYLALSEDSAVVTGSTFFGSTLPTATSFYVGSGLSVAARTIVAYLFATCPGVSKVGSYTGNGTTQTIDCGFAAGARFVLIKRTDSTGDWYVYDTARGMTTLTDPYLLLNSTAAESATLGSVTTVATGFALNATILAAINASGGIYIFLAIA